MQAVIAKELREHAKWLALGLGAFGVAVGLAGKSAFGGPLGEPWSGLYSYVGLAGALFAVLLGGLQGVLDFSVASGDFLFQRGLSRRRIVTAKLLAGAIFYFTAAAIPLAIWAAWAAQTSINFTPVSWTLVWPALLTATYAFILHPATLFCLERPARWYGTKFLPLVPAASVVMLGFSTLFETPFTVAVAILIWAGGLAVYIAGLVGWRPSRVPVMLVSVGIAMLMGYIIIDAQWRALSPLLGGQEVGVDAQGRVWEYNFRTQRDDQSLAYRRVYTAARRLGGGDAMDEAQPVPAGFEPQGFAFFISLSDARTLWRKFRHSGGMSGLFYYDNAGLVYDYDWGQRPPLRATFTPDGGKPGWQTQGSRFTGNAPSLGYQITSTSTATTSTQGSPAIWADSQGIYQVDISSGSVRQILSGPLDAATGYRSSRTAPPELLVRQGNVVRHYRWSAQDPNQPIFENYGDLPVFVQKLPLVKLELIAELPPLPDFVLDRLTIAVASPGAYTVVANLSDRIEIRSWKLGDEGTWQFEQDRMGLSSVQPSALRTALLGIISSAFAIPFLLLGILISLQQGQSASHVISTLGTGTPQPMLLAMVLVASLVLALVAVEVLSRRRSLSSRDRWLWRIATVFFGLAAPLAMLALYEPIAHVVCGKCDKRRSVKLRRCEHCGAAWPKSPSTGIELLERPARDRPVVLSEAASS